MPTSPTKGERIAIVGSRYFPDLGRVRAFVRDLAASDPDAMVVSGGAGGVDDTAVYTAGINRLAHLVFPAQWDRHGRSAGFIRNALIVEHCDRVVAFWDGKSRGTMHTVNLAKRAGKAVEVIRAE